jgi:hypothetical protein
MHNIHANDQMYPIASPSHFNDPDMLQVGNVGLTLDEQKSHFALWCIAGAPLLAGTDIIHASNETLAILTAQEVVAVNQDLGVGGRLQGKFIGPVAAATPSTEQHYVAVSSSAAPKTIAISHTAAIAGTANTARMVKCNGGASQQWIAVDPTTGAPFPTTKKIHTPTPFEKRVQLQQKSTGGLLDVTGCNRAPLSPPFAGPKLMVTTDGTTTPTSPCSGKDLLFTFQRNGSITSSIDGQCLNVYGHGTNDGKSGIVQLFSCKQNGKESNGLFKFDADGTITDEMNTENCLDTGSSAPSPPSPPPAGTGSELWVKPLSDGSRLAVLLLNLDDTKTMDLHGALVLLNWIVYARGFY